MNPSHDIEHGQEVHEFANAAWGAVGATRGGGDTRHAPAANSRWIIDPPTIPPHHQYCGGDYDCPACEAIDAALESGICHLHGTRFDHKCEVCVQFMEDRLTAIEKLVDEKRECGCMSVSRFDLEDILTTGRVS